jgi:hypothetical protein
MMILEEKVSLYSSAITWVCIDRLYPGWSYQYISPDNLRLDQAYVENGVLAPNGPSWKAIIIQSNQNITTKTIKQLKQISEAGVPILLVGGIPGYFPLGSGCSEGSFKRELANLVALPGVFAVPKGDVAKKLREIPIEPRIRLQTSGNWYTTLRDDESDGTDYVFVLNDSPPSSGEITLSSRKTPFWLDMWSGDESPVMHYRSHDGKITIPLELQTNQAVVIALRTPEASESDLANCWIDNTTSIILGYATSSPSTIAIHIPSSSTINNITLSNSKSVQIESNSVPSSFNLSDWTLTVEHWERPLDTYDAQTVAVKRNTTHELRELVAWTEIPSLVNVSGIGFYETSFKLPPNTLSGQDNNHSGAYISFTTVLHALRLHINGILIPPFDPHNPIRDITPFLKDGSNTILVTVPSTMMNYITSIWPDIRMVGQIPDVDPVVRSGSIKKTQNGLVGAVTITPFTKRLIDC